MHQHKAPGSSKAHRITRLVFVTRMRSIRIFLSSPGDCAAERQAVHAVVRKLNDDSVVRSFATLEVVAWDWQGGIPMEAHQSPQTSVNQRLPVPESCEVYVGIFRCRFGSPLPADDLQYRKTDGQPFGSGSEYEFHRAWDARRRGAPLPHLYVYRQQPLAEPCPDAAQWARLEAFFAAPPFMDDDRHAGFVHSFRDAVDLSTQLEHHLRELISQWCPDARAPLGAWLKQQAKTLTHDAGPRYTADAHVESEISRVFDWLLARPVAVMQFDEHLAEIWKHLPDEAPFEPHREPLGNVAHKLREDPVWQAPPDFQPVRDLLQKLNERALDQYTESSRYSRERKETDRERYRRDGLNRLMGAYYEARELLNNFAPYTQRRVLLLTGQAGQGKTHTLVHELNRALDNGEIAVGVLGHTLSATGDLWSAMLQRLGYSGGKDVFLDELENAAARRRQRALIVIDALNETTDRARWKGQLSGLLADILARPHLTVALGVRSDYRQLVLPLLAEGAPTPWVEYRHPGFGEVGADALTVYCAHYGVQVPVAPPIGELSNPLYVQLLVKSLKGRHDPVYWLPSWLDVWQGWLAYLEEDTVGKLELDDPSRRHPMRRTLNRLADAMIDAGSFRLLRHEADRIAEETCDNRKAIAWLLSAGALLDQTNDEDEDFVTFAYERLCDTFIVNRLLTKLFRNLSDPEARRQALVDATTPGGPLYPLVSPAYMDHPLNDNRAGLLRALCLMAPREMATEIPALLPREYKSPHGDWMEQDDALQEAYLDSLRWRYRQDDFGSSPQGLLDWFNALDVFHSEHDELDELIRLAVIPGHPFAMEHILHPWLRDMSSPGERDAAWSIHLVPLWIERYSNLNILLRWAGEANLSGLHASVALPSTRLLAWITSSSQRAQRQSAIRGLTRLLAACPEVLPDFLPDFLAVDDAYVLEGVLIALLGGVLHGRADALCMQAASLVYESQFVEGNARWCHLTIRHYARRIVEEAHSRGWLADVDLTVVRPPYRSALPLDVLPSEDELRSAQKSSGYRSITGSCFGHDFYWYVMGATSGSKHFLSKPLKESQEPNRSLERVTTWWETGDSSLFNVNLSARFVVWNCTQLGWTPERFNDFDTGEYNRYTGRISDDGRTERIGKKYQWIGWHTMLGYLSDNYEMLPDWDKTPQVYDTPHQISYIEVLDPSRWLYTAEPKKQRTLSRDGFWSLRPPLRWPTPTREGIHRWAEASANDLLPSDLIHHTPTLPPAWGPGPWIQLATEHAWVDKLAPGLWGIGQCYQADIWWQVWPVLIETKDLPKLCQELEKPDVRERLAGTGRIDGLSDSTTSLTAWTDLMGRFDEGFRLDPHSSYGTWLPVPWMPMVAYCGHPDRNNEHRPVLMPWPRLFREWGLSMNLDKGCIMRDQEMLFGLAGWSIGENALFARPEPLQRLLASSGYSLIWLMRGERRAFLNSANSSSREDCAWVDYHAVGFLGEGARTQTLWFERVILPCRE